MTIKFYNGLSFALLITVLAMPVYGQEAEDGIEDYVVPIAATNNVRFGLSTKDYRMRFFTNSDKVLDFSNRGVNALVGARFGKFNLTLSLPLARGGNLLGTDARQLALNLDFYQPWGYLQLNAQRIKGFEEEDLLAETFSYRPDAKITQVGIYGFRVLNNRFSLRAAFKNSERQLKSQGSFLIAATLQYQELNSDGINLVLRDGSELTIGDYHQEKLGLGVGYGHTWSTEAGWYVTPVFVVGGELRRNTYVNGSGGEDLFRYRFSPRVRGRLAFGYNGERYFASMRASTLPGLEVGTRLNARIRNTRVVLVVGRRLMGKKQG